ncbi:unnamed protein product [Sphenostylis stenocarpa]|uniref:TMEM205-like domain-containing protein n=1 Tax=Sphenostylis stenocarpa TaxID=92480 RepID=A0AA87B8J4_9FABA|nr:unnamed protein product [Sphenostylis stenocarpa]
MSLVISSLAAAGLLSPTPETQQKQGANTIVKEGHRVVVVEYDQDGHHNTKISISPEQPSHHHHHHDNQVLDNAKDKIKEAASVLPNLGGISQPQDAAFLHAPKELICDAYGKCKHKIVDAMEKTKDKAQEALEKKKEEISAKKEAARQVGDTVANALGKTKESVYDKARDVHDYAQDTVETAKDHVANNVSDAWDSLRHLKHALKSSVGSLESLNSLMGVANLLGFATAYGMCVWVTFISSYVQSRAMPRHQFAVVQSKIYPVYFRAMAYSIGVALFGHVLGNTNTLLSNKPHRLQAYNLLASLATVFFNSLYLEPRATKLMFERIKIEKEEGRGREDVSGERGRTGVGEHQRTADPKEPSTSADQDAVRSRIIKLNDKLKKLNSYSSLLNILNLMSLTWHLVYLAQRLHRTC